MPEMTWKGILMNYFDLSPLPYFQNPSWYSYPTLAGAGEQQCEEQQVD